MKLKYWTFIIALYAGSLCSCSDFLSEDPKGNITTNYSETEEGCERLVLSLYNTHRDFLERLYLFGSMGADEQLVAVNGNDWRYFGEYFDTQMINNGWNRDFWKQLYNSLNVANLATEIIETAEIKDEGRRLNFVQKHMHYALFISGSSRKPMEMEHISRQKVLPVSKLLDINPALLLSTSKCWKISTLPLPD